MQGQKPDFDTGVVHAWVSMWNTYDLSLLERLFLNDERVTYFSSEKQGIIRGIDALRQHHERFGFVTGGKVQENRLWLEEMQSDAFEASAIVTAIWCFQRAGSERIQRGPVTLVYVRSGGEHRIAHANFGNYP